MRRIIPFLSQSLPWLLLALGLAPLVAWAYLGSFTRYLADDYSTSSELLKAGFWPAQAYWYQAWSGRYAYTFLVSLVELAGVGIVAWLPWLALSAWFLSLFWALKQIFSALDIPLDKKWLAVLAAAILFGTIKSLPNYSEVVFWQTGLLTYQTSNIFLAFFLALFLKRFFSEQGWQSNIKKKVSFVFLRVLRPPWYVVGQGGQGFELSLIFIIALFVGGFSETWIVIQLALLTLGLLYFAFLYKNQNRIDILKTLVTAWFASCCSLVAIVKAPGNLARNASLGALSFQSLSLALLAAVKDTPLFLFEWARDNSVLVVLLLLAGAFAGFFAVPAAAKEKVNSWLRLGLSLLALACVLMSAGFFPSFVAWGARPPDRAVFIPVFIFTWAYVVFGFFLGCFLNSYIGPGRIRKALQGLMLLALVAAFYWMQVRTTIATVQLVPTLRVYAQLWDQRDAFLRQAAAQHKGNVILPSLRRNPALSGIRSTVWLVGELDENPENWINRAASSYYGLESISGK